MDREKVIELAREVFSKPPMHIGSEKLLAFAALIEAEVRGDVEPVPVAWCWVSNGRPEEKPFYGKGPDQDIIERAAAAEIPRTVQYFYTHPAPAVQFEFSDKGKAEIVICPKGLTYGVRCVDFPKVFAQFTFESDANQFVKIFNGTVAPRVESPVTGGGGGFESRPVPTNDPTVVRQLVEALEQLMSIVKIHSRATSNNFAWAEMDFAKEALAAAKEAGL